MRRRGAVEDCALEIRGKKSQYELRSDKAVRTFSDTAMLLGRSCAIAWPSDGRGQVFVAG